MELRKTIAYITTVVLLSACAQVSVQRSQNVQLDGETWVTEGQGKVRKLGKGEILQVESEPVLVERPGHLGVLVLPPGQQTEDFKLTLRPLSEFGGQYVDTYLNQFLTRMLADVTRVQQLLSQRKAGEALSLVQNMRETHPRVSYLLFLEASCHVVAGNTERAVSLLKRGLEEFPQEVEAKKLYRSLAGGGDQ